MKQLAPRWDTSVAPAIFFMALQPVAVCVEGPEISAML